MPLEPSAVSSTDEDLARWAHAWAAAASQTYDVIESAWDAESPATAIGRRDVMAMVLVDAARNVSRGAERLLGEDSAAVRRFNEEHPTLKEVRDRLEHYDDYVRGSGNAQRAGGRWGGEPLTLAMSGLNLPASRGGGLKGHVVQVSVTERAEDGAPVEVTYEVATRAIAVATRTLARDMLDEAGLLDDYHVERCEMCADPNRI